MQVFRRITLVCALAYAPMLQAGTALETMQSRADMLGWEAVGRLDLPSGGFCTGVLVARDLVLTAAHCLFDHQTAQKMDLTGAKFRAGYLYGNSLFDRAIVASEIPEAYQYAGPVMLAQDAALDVALLRLDRAVAISEARPFPLFQSARITRNVQVMSYGRDRSEAMSWQRECHVLRQSSELLEFDCDTTFGSSGAPVFARQNGHMHILSIVSGNWATDAGENRVIGMKLNATYEALRRKIGGGALRISTGAKRVLVGQGTQASGAKFIRP